MLLDSDRNRLRHMVQAAEQAVEYACRRTIEEVENAPPLQHLFLRNLEIIGEAASRISPELRAAHPEIPWRDMMDMRNRLIRAYFDIDMEIVWRTIREALPELICQLRTVLDAESRS
ncbi:MAG: DUF86 domain-containing protein [Candidatus Hydrogenedentes bacterium]|nr:DUF86 domain-containing protein [Candidatus Hydrogenedentota bacterium]